jgi:uncharacterized protein with HEPN domain
LRGDDERLRDIAEAIERIERYAKDGRTAFEGDELIQNWMVHHLQIIGEAARRLSDDWKASHQQIPWRAIVGMRHVLVHSYFEIDLDVVWSTVENDLPQLKTAVVAALDDNADATSHGGVGTEEDQNGDSQSQD